MFLLLTVAFYPYEERSEAFCPGPFPDNTAAVFKSVIISPSTPYLLSLFHGQQSFMAVRRIYLCRYVSTFILRPSDRYVIQPQEGVSSSRAPSASRRSRTSGEGCP